MKKIQQDQFQIFARVLYIWAIRHPASGYVQGINDLVTPFFVVFLSEFISDGQFGFSLNFCLKIFFEEGVIIV